MTLPVNKQRRGVTPARVVALGLIALAVLGLGYLRFSPDSAAVSVPAGAHAGALTLKPCSYATENGSYRADCGTLVVPENRANPHSRLIALPVTRIRARSAHPAEPVFRLEGGPGITNMDFKDASRFTANRDLVLVGYRGVDGSSVLNCPEVESALGHSTDVLTKKSFRAYGDALRSCATRLRADGVDLAGYSLTQQVDDLEAARVALGYGRIDLVSESVGTRTAMIYSWRYPGSIHRSVMIGVNPPGHYFWDPKTTDDQIRRYADACSKDASCSTRTDDLAASMRRTAAHIPDRWLFLPIKASNVRIATFFGLFETTSDVAPISGPMTLLDHEPQRKRLCVYLLGQFEVVVDGRAVPDDAWRHGRAARLVKVLALAPHHRLHREQVMDLLWPDSEPARAANNLHQALHIARQILDPDRSRETELVRLQSELVSLAADSEVWVDVDLFEAAAARAIADKNLVGLQAAARMYTGDLLPDDPYHEWTLDRRAALKSIYLRLNAEIVSLAAAAGDLGSAVRSCEEIVRLDATREDAHTQLMHLYSLSGRRHEALRQYETLEQVLRDELGLEPEPASRRLYGAILNGTFPGTAAGTHQQLTPDLDEPQPSPTPPPGNLPQQVNRFVGRAQDIADLRHTMGNAHLVTLTGTGGCGKTRLAIQLAHEVKDHSSIGAWMVELAGLRDPLLVPQAVASALGVTERPDQPLIETLADHLGSRDVLLVLDNCEHLIGAAAALTDRLLAACPLLRVLATSREPLHIPGEVVWRVSSLGVPDPKHVPNIPTLRRIEAVELFLDRAQAALPGFEMSAANAGAIARICHRLDGIPLALELAAARVGALSVEHILERLDDCFTVLKGGSRTALSRQQTLKALLDWSHDLLAEQERALFRRLAVFTGGFSFTAAEAVGGGGVLDALTGLIDKSLVQVDRQEEEVRYRVLEPVRQYANLHLVASGECATIQSAHAEWYTDFARRADSELWGKDHRKSIEELEKEHDNLRAALGRCAQGELEAALGLALVDRLWQFWLLGGYLTEGRRWLDALLAQNPPGSTHKAAALLHASNLALRQGDYGRKVEELIKESSMIYQMCNDDAGRCRTMRTLGTQSYINGDYASAGRYFRECERLAALSGQEGERALAVHELGIVAWARSAYGEARLLLEEARTLFAFMATAVTLSAPFLNVPMTEAPYAEDSDVLTIQEETWAMLRRLTPPAAAALSLVHIATVARQMGANEEAHQFLLQSIELFHLNGDMEGLSQALAQWGNLYRAEGNYDRARDCLYQSLELRRELGDRRGVGRSLNNLGVVALYAGNPQRAYAFFAESMNLFESMNDLPGIAATLENQGHEALFLERWNEAKRAYERSVALAHEMGGVKRERAFDLRHIGLAARGDGDESSAIAAFRASRSLFAEMGDQRSAQIADRLLGNVEAPGTTLQSCR